MNDLSVDQHEVIEVSSLFRETLESTGKRFVVEHRWNEVISTVWEVWEVQVGDGWRRLMRGRLSE